jgi:hypothetical protein
MNDETFNLSIRRFLKMVGVKSQHEIEQAVSVALREGKLKGAESVTVHMTLRLPDLDLDIPFVGRIELE